MKRSLFFLLCCALAATNAFASSSLLEELDERIRALEEKCTGRQTETAVEFEAYLGPGDGGAWPADAQIIFQDTSFNVGDGFFLSGSAFEPPVPGPYLFHFSAECLSESGHCHLQLHLNGEEAAGYINDAGAPGVAHQVSFFSVMELEEGDQVTVRTGQTDGGDEDMLHYTHAAIRFYGRLVNA